jgi:predicted ATP-dependent protease
VEGDSASSTELYALLSNLANLPVKQGIAVTGSVNQKGQVQAIGGVNDKVEGYFELCRKTGLTGEQGVIIPSANKKNLMLREDVQEAVREGRFHIWTVDTIDDGIEILTGLRAGNIAEEGTVNYLVNKTLQDYHQRMLEEDHEEEEKPSHTPDSGRWVTDVV